MAFLENRLRSAQALGLAAHEPLISRAMLAEVPLAGLSVFEAVVAGVDRRDAKDDARTTHFTTQQEAVPHRTISPRSLEDRVAQGLARGEATTGKMARETKVGPV